MAVRDSCRPKRDPLRLAPLVDGVVKSGRKQRRLQRRNYRRRTARGLTPQEIAKKVLASDLAECLRTGDRTKLAEQIAQLTDHERYILAMAAEGRSAPEIARYLFDPIQRV